MLSSHKEARQHAIAAKKITPTSVDFHPAAARPSNASAKHKNTVIELVSSDDEASQAPKGKCRIAQILYFLLTPHFDSWTIKKGMCRSLTRTCIASRRSTTTTGVANCCSTRTTRCVRQSVNCRRRRPAIPGQQKPRYWCFFWSTNSGRKREKPSSTL